ncbi:MAG TPA: hypothetical protein VIL35_10010 [Vicinamibacterales bacterium]
MRQALNAYTDGMRRVLHAPALLAGAYFALLLVTLPTLRSVQQAVADQLGASAWADEVAARPDIDWFAEFAHTARGAARDLQPSVIGFAAVLRNFSDLVESVASRRPSGSSPEAWSILALVFLGGTFLSGGILDRYARQRRTRAHGFFGASGALFFRLLRLNLGVLLIHAAVLGTYAWIAGALYGWLTRDLTSERTAFLFALALTIGGAILALAITIVADSARVRMVVEDRRSAIFALAAGARFARRHAGGLLLLYALLLASLTALLVLYALAAPTGASTAYPFWAGIVAGQIYVAGRIALKLLTYSSVTSFFQSALAHASYVAAPMPVWPESPAVETLGPPVDR